jgi:hypothetical protein
VFLAMPLPDLQRHIGYTMHLRDVQRRERARAEADASRGR